MTMIVRGAGETDEVAAIALWRCCGLLVGHNDPAVDFRFARGRENSDVLLGFGTDGRVIASAMVGHDGHRAPLSLSLYFGNSPEFWLNLQDPLRPEAGAAETEAGYR